MYNVYKVTADRVCVIIAAVSINSATNLGAIILGVKPSSVSLDHKVSNNPGVIKVIWY